MPLTVAAKKIALDAIARNTNPTSYAQYVGLFQADSGKSVTAVGSTGVFTATAHGYANGDVVILSALTGGTGFVAGNPYFVTNVTANTFTLAYTSGGATVTGGTDITAGTVTRVVELTGGSPAYARIASAFTAATDPGTSDDATSHSINVPGGVTVTHVGYWSALTTGTLMAVNPVTNEVFAGQGTYSVTDSKFTMT